MAKQKNQPLQAGARMSVDKMVLNAQANLTSAEIRQVIDRLEESIKSKELQEKKAKLLAELAEIDSALGVEQPKEDKEELGE